jgi:DNA-binding SARP family transcriptional activator
MQILRISLFGNVRVAYDALPAKDNLTRVVQTLLAYLVLHRNRCHPRETLAGIFWGEHDEGRARHSLRTALWRLRHILEPDGVPEGAYLVTMANGEIGFNELSRHWLDVAVFEQHASRILGKPFQDVAADEVQGLETALQLYTGELLEGFYEDWILRERERLRRLYLSSLTYLMRIHRHQGTYEAGLACGQTILQHDPLREEIHREVMQMYLASGQRALAVRQFDICRETLKAELGIAPMEETQRLCAQIAPEIGERMKPAQEPADLQQALQQLRLALLSVDGTRMKLKQTIHLVERLTRQSDQDPSKTPRPGPASDSVHFDPYRSK